MSQDQIQIFLDKLTELEELEASSALQLEEVQKEHENELQELATLNEHCDGLILEDQLITIKVQKTSRFEKNFFDAEIEKMQQTTRMVDALYSAPVKNLQHELEIELDVSIQSLTQDLPKIKEETFLLECEIQRLKEQSGRNYIQEQQELQKQLIALKKQNATLRQKLKALEKQIESIDNRDMLIDSNNE